MTRFAIRLATLAAAWAFVLQGGAGSASAQSVVPEDFGPVHEAKPERETQFAVEAGYDHLVETDYDGLNGEIERDTANFRASAMIPMGEALTLTVIGRYQWDGYGIEGGAAESRFTWSDVHSVIAGALLSWRIDEKWVLSGGPIYRNSGEPGADAGKASQYGGLFGVTYIVRPGVRVGALVGIISGMEDSATILPIPQVNWTFAERWTWKVGASPLGGTVGVGSELVFAFTDQLSLGAGFQLQNRRFRLDDSGGGLAGRRSDGSDDKDGVGQERSFPVFLRLGYTPSADTLVEAFGGVVLAGETITENDDGDQLSQQDYDPTGIIGLRGRIRF